MTDLINLVFDSTNNPPQTQQVDMLSTLYPLIMVVLMVAVFYFLILRPQRKRDKEQKEMLSKLSVGDKITTIGGLVGVIAQIKDDEITISTSIANTLVTYTKAAIQTVEKRDSSSSSSSKSTASKSEDKDSSEEPKKGLFGRKKTDEE